jgi:methionyl aminopeptidase
MFAGINICKPGVKYSEIGKIIEQYAHKFGYSVNQEFCGHGISSDLHMSPYVHHHSEGESKAVMRPGNVFTIEPILMMKPRDPRGYV